MTGSGNGLSQVQCEGKEPDLVQFESKYEMKNVICTILASMYEFIKHILQRAHSFSWWPRQNSIKLW